MTDADKFNAPLHSDRAFLMFIHDRLVAVHGDPPQADYMGKLRSIIMALDETQETPNTAPKIPGLAVGAKTRATCPVCAAKMEGDKCPA